MVLKKILISVTGIMLYVFGLVWVLNSSWVYEGLSSKGIVPEEQLVNSKTVTKGEYTATLRGAFEPDNLAQYYRIKVRANRYENYQEIFADTP